MGTRALVGVVALVAGCQFVASIDPARDGGVAPALPFSAACQACVDTSCAAEARTCAESPGCAPLGRCLADTAPGDVAGRGTCEATHATALADPAFAALDRCLRGPCLDVCLGRGGLFTAYPPACSACLDGPNGCGEPIAACIADGACERVYHRCFGDVSPPDPDRITECFYVPDNASAATDAVQACLVNACQPDCPFHRDASCAGRYRFVPAPNADNEFRLRMKFAAYGVAGAGPATGVVAEVCTVPFIRCGATPPATLDADSVLDLRLPRTSGFGFQGPSGSRARPRASRSCPSTSSSGCPSIATSTGANPPAGSSSAPRPSSSCPPSSAASSTRTSVTLP